MLAPATADVAVTVGVMVPIVILTPLALSPVSTFTSEEVFVVIVNVLVS